MRIYDPRLGRFLSVDPLATKYPELTPYQFASNTPIRAIDLDGLEAAAVDAYKKAKKYGYDALKIQRVDAGFGNVQTQLYSLKAHGNSQEFGKLKEAFINSPQKITNNTFAKYSPVNGFDKKTLNEGDEIAIQPKIGVVPIAPVPVYVRVIQIENNANSFKLTFATLEGHPEAGFVSFSGSIDEKTGEITVSILTETREVWGISKIGPSRVLQKAQWEEVIGNIRESLGKEKKDVKESESIQEYKYDENKPMGKGEKKSDKTTVINE
jgi:hypothetical protein